MGQRDEKYLLSGIVELDDGYVLPFPVRGGGGCL